MTIGISLFYLYLTIGIIYSVYDWNKNKKEEYETLRLKGMAEDGMVAIWFLMTIMFWPIYMFFNNDQDL